MKRFVLTLLIFSLLLSFMAGCKKGKSSDNTNKKIITYNIADIGDKYSTQGRVRVSGNGITLTHTATGLLFSAECSGDVKLSVTASDINTETGYGVYLTVFVDGNRQKNRIAVKKEGSLELTVAESLDFGKHSFEIYRQTENGNGNVTVKEIKLSGKLQKTNIEKKLNIEFIGDGLTTGIGNNVSGGNMASLSADTPMYQDGTKSYAFYTARYLKADFSIVAENNFSLLCNDTPDRLKAYYKTFPGIVNEYIYSDEPDVIVLNLGTNDYENRFEYNKSLEDIYNSSIDFIKYLKEIHPDSKIVVLGGMMEESLDNLYQKSIEKDGGENVYHLSLPKDVSGINGFPKASGHENAAKVLVDFLQKLLK